MIFVNSSLKKICDLIISHDFHLLHNMRPEPGISPSQHFTCISERWYQKIPVKYELEVSALVLCRKQNTLSKSLVCIPLRVGLLYICNASW